MKKKCIYMLIIVLMIGIQIIPTFASNITKEQFKNAVLETVADTYGTIISDDTITINNKYYIDYDLTNKPTFSIDVNVTKDMTWKEWSDEFSKDVWLELPFEAIAHIKGIDGVKVGISEASQYYTKNVTLKRDCSENITASNYTNYDIIEETKKMFNEKKIETELFTYMIEEQNETDTTYSIKVIMEIKEDADFSILKQENTNIGNIVPLNEIEDKAENGGNIGINQIPQTGKTIGNIDVLFAILLISVSVLVLYIVYNRKIDGNR